MPAIVTPDGNGRGTAAAAALLLLLIAAWFAPVLLPGPAPWLGMTLLSVDERPFPPFVEQADASVATRPQNFITSDLQGWILSHTQAEFDRMRRGELPLWDEHELLGRPLHGDASFPTFYPPDWIGLLTTPVRAYAISSALHCAIAALGMLLLLRRIGVTPLAAALGALAFGAGGWIFVHLHIPHFLRCAAWFPWIVAASRRLAQEPSARRAGALAAALALLALAGYPQLLGVVLFASALAALLFVMRSPRQGRAVAWHGAALAAGLLAGAVQLLPVAELRAHSLRSEAIPDELAARKSLRPIHLASLIAPDFQGHPVALQQAGIPRIEEWPPAREFFGAEVQDNYVEDTLYGGVVTLLLALVALVASRRRGAVLAFGALAVVALFVALPTPLQPLFRNLLIPGLGAGSPKRVLLLFAFALAGLAALGFEPLLLGVRRARIALLAASLLVVGLCAAGFVTTRALLPSWLEPGEEASRGEPFRALLAAAFATPAAIALLAAAIAPWFREGRARVAASVLFALLAADLGWFGLRFNPFQPPQAEARPTAVVAFLDRPENRGRTLRYPTRNLLPASLSSKWGVASVDGIQALIVREVGELLCALEPGVIDPVSPNQVGSFDGLPDADASPSRPPESAFLARPLVGLLARWIVTNQVLPAELGLALRYDGSAHEGLGLYEHPHALPELFFTDRVAVEPDRAKRLAQLAAPDFAPSRVAIAEAADDVRDLPRAALVASAAAPAEAPPAVEVKSERPTPELLRASVQTPVAGLLVVNQTFFPGWRLTVDGVERTPIRVDHALLGIVVAAGAHEIELRYRPTSFTAGAALSLAAVASIALLLAWPRRRRPGEIQAISDETSPEGVERTSRPLGEQGADVAGVRGGG